MKFLYLALLFLIACGGDVEFTTDNQLDGIFISSEKIDAICQTGGKALVPLLTVYWNKDDICLQSDCSDFVRCVATVNIVERLGIIGSHCSSPDNDHIVCDSLNLSRKN